ncbi:MAG: family 43 glycosylhydrolase, partial [Duncaniella sp.]|nr:family 43 glycosylhydrolase [Duncaniella sp.]
TQHSEVIYRGDSPMGPFEPWKGNPILTQRTLDSSRSNPVTCAGHADLVKAPDGSWWSVFLACRPIENDIENLGRETFMLPVRWTEDGWPYITRDGETIAMQFDMPGTIRDDSSMTGNFAWKETFSDSILGLEWHTLRGPATEYYSLTANPGHLTLKCGNVSSTDKAELPFVCRRIQHHKYTASTTLTFVPAHDRQCAGMLLFKDELHQYFLGKALRDGSQHIVLRRISDNGTEELAGRALSSDNSSVDLRVESKGLSLDFAYSTDNGSTWQPLASDLDAAFMSTAKAGGFTGTTIGLYASDVE